MIKKIVVNGIKACQLELDLFLKLKYESRTILLFIDVRYSMRDLLYDLNNYALPKN